MESVIFAALSLELLESWLPAFKNFALVAIGLGFVIFVHELGHFLVAKACGVKCEKFYVGFDVPINLGLFTIPGKLVHFQWGETEYGIGAIPLGGYVKMLGQDDNPDNAVSEDERTKVRDEAGNVRLDPRSYQAKSVPQRMAIISAGVIMNLIFGLIFAAVAYGWGVMIQPAVIGATSPGDPAWKHNLRTGDRILQVGKSGQPNEHMRFMKDMMLNLALYGKFDKDYDIKIQHANGEEEWVQMRPSDRHRNAKEGLSRPTLGITPTHVPVFGRLDAAELTLLGLEYADVVAADNEREPITDFSDVATLMTTHASVRLKLASKIGRGDRLVAIDGEQVENYADIQRLLARKPGEAITVTIERAAKKDAASAEGSQDQSPEQYTLTLSPRPVRDYGIEMEASPITAVQQDSPAADAGFKAGDRLISFAGEPIGDPLSFPQRTLAHVGKTVDVEVERGDDSAKEVVRIPIELRAPRQMYWSAMSTGAAVETMGIAYEIKAKVAKVPEEGPAAGKLEPGDEIVKVQFKPAGAAQLEVESALMRRPEDPIELDGRITGWPAIVYQASIARLPDTALVVTFKRGGDSELQTAELMSVPSEECFIDHHGLDLTLKGLEELHQADSFTEAVSLGFREMKERVMEVGTVLYGLVTGRISFFNMGGGITIFRAAASEAERGPQDLLLFFAFLSANLAVLNILPIPVLDGGHLLFLAYEGIRRKPVNPEIQMRLTYAGLIFLLALMLLVNGLDVWRLFV